MSSDYKYDIQVRAEELASERFDCEFYDLPADKQELIYKEATDDWTESLAEKADFLNDQAKEKDALRNRR